MLKLRSNRPAASLFDKHVREPDEILAHADGIARFVDDLGRSKKQEVLQKVYSVS
jgi:hypothetical protein